MSWSIEEEITKLTDKSVAYINNQYVYWTGNPDTSTDVVAADTVTQATTNYNAVVAARPLKELREERDKKLAETDWWASSDLTMTTAQTNYRQALRDITNTYTSLDTVVWPTKP